MCDLAILDPHERLEPLIDRMEVRRRVIVEIHADHIAKEERDDGHYCFIGGLPALANLLANAARLSAAFAGET